MLRKLAAALLSLSLLSACATAGTHSPPSDTQNDEQRYVVVSVVNDSWATIGVRAYQGGARLMLPALGQISSMDEAFDCVRAETIHSRLDFVVDPKTGEQPYKIPLHVAPQAGDIVKLHINEYDPYSTVADVTNAGNLYVICE